MKDREPFGIFYNPLARPHVLEAAERLANIHHLSYRELPKDTEELKREVNSFDATGIVGGDGTALKVMQNTDGFIVLLGGGTMAATQKTAEAHGLTTTVDRVLDRDYSSVPEDKMIRPGIVTSSDNTTNEFLIFSGLDSLSVRYADVNERFRRRDEWLKENNFPPVSSRKLRAQVAGIATVLPYVVGEKTPVHIVFTGHLRGRVTPTLDKTVFTPLLESVKIGEKPTRGITFREVAALGSYLATGRYLPGAVKTEQRESFTILGDKNGPQALNLDGERTEVDRTHDFVITKHKYGKRIASLIYP